MRSEVVVQGDMYVQGDINIGEMVSTCLVALPTENITVTGGARHINRLIA